MPWRPCRPWGPRLGVQAEAWPTRSASTRRRASRRRERAIDRDARDAGLLGDLRCAPALGLELTGFKPNALVSKHVAQEIERLGLRETRTRLHDLVGYIDRHDHRGIVPVGSTVDVQAAALFQEALELMGVAPPEQIAVGA